MLETGSVTNSSLIKEPPQTTQTAKNGQMGKDEFLKLLLVQMQNQDPMSPMDSQDFSSQIAQFSQVEQLEQMSKSLTKSNEIDLMLTQAITNTMSTTLVGKRAKTLGNQVMITKENKAEVSFNLSRSASNVKITVKDDDGKIVRTIEKTGMVKGDHTIDWDGLDKNGNKLSKDKKYTYTVEATDSNGKPVKTDTYMLGIIQGVEYSGNSTLLLLNTGQKAPFSSVLEIKAAEDFL